MGEGASLPQSDGFGKNLAVPPLPGLPEGAGGSEAPFWPGLASRTHTDELTLREALTCCSPGCLLLFPWHSTHREVPGPAVTELGTEGTGASILLLCRAMGIAQPKGAHRMPVLVLGLPWRDGCCFSPPSYRDSSYCQVVPAQGSKNTHSPWRQLTPIPSH